MVRETPPEQWDLARMYDEARGGPVSEKPLVAIIVPSYRESETVAQVCRVARTRMREQLASAGLDTIVAPISGDSLVCRMRQRAVHMFMMSPATHLLFIDADIEVMTPDCVLKMVQANRDIVAGACPFKNASRHTVHNLFDDAEPVVDEHGCVEVRDAGTGFMLIKRETILRMQAAHPELLHWSMSMGADRGAPLWALFDTGIVGGIYQSEDYLFCTIWQELGGKVYVYAPARFRHWGEYGYEGSFLEQHGLTWNEPAP
jgi:hypothetical protein